MMHRISRRAFARRFAALAVWFGSSYSALAQAQRPAPPRQIGILLAESNDKLVEGLKQGLRDAGYIEGRDVVFETRSAGGDYERFSSLASDLVQRQFDVIVVLGTNAALAAKRATPTIPIVMALVADPVGSGLVANLAHPGANVTGLSMMVTDISAKRLQLLKEMIPRVARVAVIWNPSLPWHKTVVEELKAAARSLSVTLKFVSVRRAEEIDLAYSEIRRARAQAVYLIDSDVLWPHRARLLKLASDARLPAIYGEREFVENGGLMSYSANFADAYRRAAYYVDRILKGAKPADLPVEQPTRFELVVNLRTAKALGITLPEAILIRADEMIK